MMLAVLHTPDYVDYATAHVTELIEGISRRCCGKRHLLPAGGDLAAPVRPLLQTSLPDGIINDRWIESTAHRVARSPMPWPAWADGWSSGSGRSFLTDTSRRPSLPTTISTSARPEYATFDSVQDKKGVDARSATPSSKSEMNGPKTS